MQSIAGEQYIFQQDGASSHTARETVALLRERTPTFIEPWQWPPCSPDLNPVDYKIWGVLQKRVYRTPIDTVEQLKQRLIEEWTQFDQRIVDRS